MKQSKMLIAAIVLLACISDIYAQDWPQYFGPRQRWMCHLKKIFYAPGLSRGRKFYGQLMWVLGLADLLLKTVRLYLLDRDDKVGDNLRCFDLSTGKELWNFSYACSGIRHVSRFTKCTDIGWKFDLFMRTIRGSILY